MTIILLPMLAFAYFQPATLTNGVKKVAVFTESQAQSLFSKGYVLDTSLGAITGPDVYGDFRVHGGLNHKYKTVVIAPGGSTVGHGTTTLLHTSSGTNYLLSATGTTIILPAVGFTGTHYRFTINGAAAVNNFIIQPAGTTKIEGTLMVAGAVVDCSAETALNFVTDGENIGDYVEVMSDGTNWLIVDSGVLTGSKLTCTGG